MHSNCLLHIHSICTYALTHAHTHALIQIKLCHVTLRNKTRYVAGGRSSPETTNASSRGTAAAGIVRRGGRSDGEGYSSGTQSEDDVSIWEKGSDHAEDEEEDLRKREMELKAELEMATMRCEELKRTLQATKSFVDPKLSTSRRGSGAGLGIGGGGGGGGGTIQKPSIATVVSNDDEYDDDEESEDEYEDVRRHTQCTAQMRRHLCQSKTVACYSIFLSDQID